VLVQYKAFLNGILLSKRLGTSQLQALAEHRKKHGIDDNMHKIVLKEIGLTESSFEEMKHTEDEVDEERLCKICYEREMNCALLPCGHMTCLQCSQRIKRCPHCRDIIKKVQKLFRS